jgi:hypothetical protein
LSSEVTATDSARAVGIAWYRAQDYGQIRRIMADAADFPATYREWREVSERLENDLRQQGHVVLRAIIDPEIFPEWCKARGLNIDAEARTIFASEVASRQAL